jgi:hypothetical protein
MSDCRKIDKLDQRRPLGPPPSFLFLLVLPYTADLRLLHLPIGSPNEKDVDISRPNKGTHNGVTLALLRAATYNFCLVGGERNKKEKVVFFLAKG